LLIRSADREPWLRQGICGAEQSTFPGWRRTFTSNGLSFGNQRRNQVRGPQYFNTDLNVLKNFNFPALGEAGKLSFGVTFFNIFNHPNFDQPVGDVADSNFG
jgi:hypothetical protein